MPRPVSSWGLSLKSEEVGNTAWVKEKMGIRMRTGFAVYHFSQIFAAFSFFIIQLILQDSLSVPGILLGIWNSKVSIGELLLLQSLEVIWNTDLLFIPILIGEAALRKWCTAPYFYNFMSLISRHFSFHIILIFLIKVIH